MKQLRLTVDAETTHGCARALRTAAEHVAAGHPDAAGTGWSYQLDDRDDLAAAAAATRAAHEHQTTVALRTLAHAVRAAHPTAHTVTLDGSDQHDCADLVAVHDATGQLLGEDTATDPKHLDVAYDAAAHVHPDRAHLLLDHLADSDRLDDAQPVRARLRLHTLLTL